MTDQDKLEPRAGVYTGQIIIAPRYHAEVLDEAERTGRTIENIMASRVEQFNTRATTEGFQLVPIDTKEHAGTVTAMIHAAMTAMWPSGEITYDDAFSDVIQQYLAGYKAMLSAAPKEQP